MSKEVLPSHSSSAGDVLRNILIAVVFVVIVGGLVYYFMQQQRQDDVQLSLPNETTEPEDVGTSVDSSTPGYKTFTGNGLGFQMDYPSDWTVDTNSAYVAVSFMSPIAGEDVFAENVNFTTEDLAPYPGTTLDDYSTAALGQIAKSMPEYTLVGQGDRTLGQYDAGYILGEYPLSGYNVEVLSVFAIENETAYIITYTGEVETHDQFVDIVDTMMASFKLL